MDIFKTEEEKVAKFLKEHDQVVKRVHLKNFIDENAFTDIVSYKAFFRVFGISYQPTNTKAQIENFCFNGLMSLKEGDRYSESVGDADYILKTRRKSYGLRPGKERQQAYRQAIANKAIVRTVVEEKEFRRDPQTLDNIEMLVSVGSEVRYADQYLRAIGIEKADSASVMVFDSHLIAGQRISGKPQKPNDMIYDGWQMTANKPSKELEDKGDVSNEYIVIRSVLDHLYGSFESARPVAGLIKELDEKRQAAKSGIGIFAL